MTVAGSPVTPAAAPLVRVRGLEFRWPSSGSVALRGVEFDLAPGELVGLLGPNGSGKSTLVRILATALRPSSGSLEWFPETPDLSRDRVRRRISIAFDRTVGLEPLGGLEYLERVLALRGFRAPSARAAAARWLDAFGLDEERDRPLATYSLGMRRRLALAEAFAARPALLLLDEPLIGLDPRARERLRSWLRVHADRGGAALLALHDGAFAADVCDRILLLHRGTLVAAGTPEELVRRLGRDTVFQVETGGSIGELEPPPPPLRVLGRSRAGYRIASPDGTAGLAPTCHWLASQGVRVRAIRVREPGLEEVFLALTGEPLEAESDSARERRPGVG